MKNVMSIRALLSLATSTAAVVALAVPALAGTVAASDPMCPRAVPKLVAFNDAGASNDVGRIAQAARDVAEIYEACAADAQSHTGGFLSAEPFLNYEKTREAQFLVVEGRALIASGDLARGMQAMRDARRLADYVANWQPESIGWEATNRASSTNTLPAAFHGSMASDDSGVSAPVDASMARRNTDRQGSRYQTAALEIRAAAEEVLIRIQSLHLGATSH